MRDNVNSLLPAHWRIIRVHAVPSEDGVQPMVVAALSWEFWEPIHLYRVYLRDVRSGLTEHSESNYVALDYVTSNPCVAVNQWLKATGEVVKQSELERVCR